MTSIPGAPSTTLAPDPIPVDIGNRLELFVDDLLVDRLQGTTFKLHIPEAQPLADHPLRGAYLSVLQDEDRYRAYYRQYADSYRGESFDGNPGETTRYAESRDGHEWTFPDLGLFTVDGSPHNNVILADQPPFSHNFAPCVPLDARSGSSPRFRALAGIHGGEITTPIIPLSTAAHLVKIKKMLQQRELPI